MLLSALYWRWTPSKEWLQTSVWFCLTKGGKYIEQVWQIFLKSNKNQVTSSYLGLLSENSHSLLGGDIHVKFYLFHTVLYSTNHFYFVKYFSFYYSWISSACSSWFISTILIIGHFQLFGVSVQEFLSAGLFRCTFFRAPILKLSKFFPETEISKDHKYNQKVVLNLLAVDVFLWLPSIILLLIVPLPLDQVQSFPLLLLRLQDGLNFIPWQRK